MKKLITLFCVMLSMIAFANAGGNLLNEQFNSSKWEGYTTSDNHKITTDFGEYILTGSSVEPTNNLMGNGASSIGRVTLTNKDSSIELPEVTSCGSITINANSGSESKDFSIQKKVGDSWQTLTTFTTHNEKESTTSGSSVVPAKNYTYKVESKEAVTFRIINATNGAVRLYEIWVAAYEENNGGDDKDYTSKEILNEQFNSSKWEGYTTSGDRTIAGVGGDYILTVASVEASNNLMGNGASSIGRVTLTNKDSSIELPEVTSCGSITINANSGSVSKSIAIQKNTGDNNWQTLTTFTTESKTEETQSGSNVVPAKNYTYEVKSEIPIKLRILNATNGAVRVYEVWVTDYVKASGNPTQIQSPETDNATIVSTRFYNVQGLPLKERPSSGVYVEQNMYDNGAVKSKKIIGINK